MGYSRLNSGAGWRIIWIGSRAVAGSSGHPGVQPRAGAATNVRVPDLAVTCSPVVEHYMATDPVIIIEILSPSNQHETYEAVRSYLGLPSLRECPGPR